MDQEIPSYNDENSNESNDSLIIDDSKVLPSGGPENISSSLPEESIEEINKDQNSGVKLVDKTNKLSVCSPYTNVFKKNDNVNNEAEDFRKLGNETEFTEVSVNSKPEIESNEDDRREMESGHELHDSSNQMPSRGQIGEMGHDVKDNVMLKVVPTTQKFHPSFFELPSSSSQFHTTPSSFPEQSSPLNLCNTSAFSKQQWGHWNQFQRLQRVKYIQSLNQEIQHTLDRLRTENNATNFARLQLKLKELFERQSVIQKNLQCQTLTAQHQSPYSNTHQALEQFHQVSSQGMGSVFNYNGKRPLEESVSTSQGQQKRLQTTPSQFFPRQSIFTQDISENILQRPFSSNLSGLHATKDMQTHGPTYQAYSNEARQDGMRQFQTQMPLLSLLKQPVRSPSFSQAPCTITRPHEDSFSQSSDSNSNFVVPLIDLKKIDQNVIKTLNQNGVDFFLPVQGSTRLGIPIMRLSVDAWRVCFPNLYSSIQQP